MTWGLQFWMAWAALAAVLAILPGSTGAPRFGLLLIIAGLVVLWLVKPVLAATPYMIFHTLLWVSIALALVIFSEYKMGGVGLLLIAAGVLTFPVWATGGSYVAGNPWLVASDILGVVAILVLGSTGIADLVDRIGRLGERSGIEHSGGAGNTPMVSGQEGSRDL